MLFIQRGSELVLAELFLKLDKTLGVLSVRSTVGDHKLAGVVAVAVAVCRPAAVCAGCERTGGPAVHPQCRSPSFPPASIFQLGSFALVSHLV